LEMKVGLVSDTHLSSDRLPEAVTNALAGVDLILHAGDLVTLDVLRHLEAIVPVTAVQGNMDLPGVQLNLPLKTVVEAAGRRIGLIHGHHVPYPERVLPPPLDYEAMHAYLLSEFPNEGVECIVYGHTHQAHVETCGHVLVINPGSATRGRVHTIGLLTIGQDSLHGEIIELS